MNQQTITPEAVLGIHFSIFDPPISNTKRKEDVNVSQIIGLIRGDKYKAITEHLRTLKGEHVNSNYKCSRFRAATFSGIFSERRSKALIHYSNLIVVDIDNVGSIADVNKLKLGLSSDSESKDSLVMCFTSPNGNGVKALYLIDHSQFSQAEWYDGICDHIKHTQGLDDKMLDKSGKDIGRACFIPHDPEVIVHSSLQSLLIK